MIPKFGGNAGKLAWILTGCLGGLLSLQTWAAGNPVISPDRAAGKSLSIIGSKLMQPYAEAVMQRLQKNAGLAPATIANEGSAAGIRVFCSGMGLQYPDVVAVSRRMRGVEIDRCVDNGVDELVEIQLGWEATVIVSRADDAFYPLQLVPFYQAVANELPDGYDFFPNRNMRWSEVDASLPDTEIRLVIPTPDLGGRGFLEDRILQAACRNIREIKTIFSAEERVRQCISLRRDGRIIEIGKPFEENVVTALKGSPPGTMAVLPMRFATENLDSVKLQPLEGVMPSAITISDRSYRFTRPLYFYVKKAHVKNYLGEGPVFGLREFITEVTRESTIGPDGYLVEMGIFPLSKARRAEVRENSLRLNTIVR